MGLQACLGMCVNAILLLTENSDREEPHHFTSVKTMWPSVFVVAFMCGTDRRAGTCCEGGAGGG